MEQVQEKKVKKVCSMNNDPSKAMGNGTVDSASLSISSKPCLANGEQDMRPFGCSNNDFQFPSEGVPSLHLPVVVVLNLVLVMWAFPLKIFKRYHEAEICKL